MDRRLLLDRTFGDPALAAEILRLFARSVGSRFRAPEPASDGEVAALAHALLGAAANIGALRLAAAARLLEREPAVAAVEPFRRLARATIREALRLAAEMDGDPDLSVDPGDRSR